MKKTLLLLSLILSSFAYSQTATPAPTDSVYIWWKQRVVPPALQNSRTWYSFWNKKTDGQPVVNSNTYVGSVNATDTVFLKVGSAYKKTKVSVLSGSPSLHGCTGYTAPSTLDPYSNNLAVTSISVDAGNYTLAAPLGSGGCASWIITRSYFPQSAGITKIASASFSNVDTIRLNNPGDYCIIQDNGASTGKWVVSYGTGNSNSTQVFSFSDTILSASILSANSSPVMLIPAPGAGKYIEVMSGSARLLYNSTTYAANTKLLLILGTATKAQIEDTQILASTATRGIRLYGSASSFGTTDNEIALNQPLYFSVGTGNPTTGNSSMFLSITYRIVTQ